jgi:hypothetical protein
MRLKRKVMRTADLNSLSESEALVYARGYVAYEERVEVSDKVAMAGRSHGGFGAHGGDSLTDDSEPF